MRNFNRLIEQARALYPINKKRGEFFHVAFLMKGKHPVMMPKGEFIKVIAEMESRSGTVAA